MGVTPERYPGTGNTDSGVGKTETRKKNPKKGKVLHFVPPRKEATPQECAGSQTRDRAKQGPGRVKKIADPKIFNQSAGKSVSHAHVAHVGMEKHTKADPCFISLLNNNLVDNSSFLIATILDIEQ
jgi:hypothetical protein